MKWIDSAITWLFPKLLLEGTAWEAQWDAKERDSFIKVARLFFAAVATGYVCHYFFYDRPMDLQPPERWIWFRVSLAGLSVLALIYYCSSFAYSNRYYRLPAIITTIVMPVSQAYVALWIGAEAWVFCFLMIIASSMILRLSALASLLYAAICIALATPILIRAGLPINDVISGTIVTLGMISVIRSSYLSDIQNFILNQKDLENQRQILDLNSEFMKRLKAFIPRVIAGRLEKAIEERGQSVLEASVNVLNAQQRDVACLFSDIRGFTQGSKDLDSFINRSVIPEVKICSDSVEKYNGIPRKVGDLIFAYFDDESVRLNLFRALAAALDISRHNHDLNATSAGKHISRYVLISCGPAIVGNLGGMNSSVEITALGSPVNLLSRIDELTKDPKFGKYLELGDILMCERSKQLIDEILEESEFKFITHKIDIKSLGLEIRDFPEVASIYKAQASDNNYDSVMKPYDFIRDVLDEAGRRQRIRAA